MCDIVRTRTSHKGPWTPFASFATGLRRAVPGSLLLLMICCAVTPPPLQAEATAGPVASRICVHNGRPTIFLNDRPVEPMLYALTDVPGGRWSWEELPQHNLRRFAEQGFRLFQVDLFLEHVWKHDGSFDIGPARRQISGVRTACPEAAVVIRLHLTAPRWWRDQHADEWVRYADVGYEEDDRDGFPRIIEDDNHPVKRVSLASDLWRNQATKLLVRLLRELSATPEGDALAGIQVADGVYGEWHNWGFYRHEPDTSLPMRQAFRQWLAMRYGDNTALRTAWGNPHVTFDDVEIPTLEDRRTIAGVFRDPVRERHVIDFYMAMQHRTADNIIHFARTVKKTWPRPILAGTFYGYFFSVFGRQAAGGHLVLDRLLRSEAIDYLSGPQAYEPQAQKLGDPYRSRSLIASVRLNGKLWLDEMDTEPTIPLPRDRHRDRLLADSLANVRRNVLFSATKGMGLWFYDFGLAGLDLDGWRRHQRGARGTWDHPLVMHEIGALRRLVRDSVEKPYHSEADVLFVYDTESFYYTASLLGTDSVSNVLVDDTSLSAFKSGVVFDPIHVDDLARIDLTPYRVVVFGNVFVLRPEVIDFVLNRVARDGRTLVWFYAPGYCDGQTLNSEFISRLTGISVQAVSLPAPLRIAVHGLADDEFTYDAADAQLNPLFVVTDPEAETFGTFAGTKRVAVARKRMDNHTAWYIALPSRDVEPLRTILETSGAHVYSNGGAIVYAGGGFLVIHTGRGGHHEIQLKNGRSVTFDLPDGAATLVLDPQTGQPLLPPVPPGHPSDPAEP